MIPVVCAGAIRVLLMVMPIPGGAEPTPHVGVTVVHEALQLLPQSLNDARLLSPAQVREVYSRTQGVLPPAGLNAFRIPDDPNIYVNAESEVYRDAARNRSAFHLLRLAATLLHEQVHETDDEYAARRLQADFVRSRLDALPPAQRASADRYWRTLEARAVSLGLAERRSRTASYRSTSRTIAAMVLVRESTTTRSSPAK